MDNTAQLKKDLTAIRNAQAAWHFVWARDGGDGKPKLRLKKTPFKPADISGYRKKGKQKLLVQGRVGKATAPDGGTVLRFACDKNHDNAELQRHIQKTLASRISALRGALIVQAGDDDRRDEATAFDAGRLPGMRLGRTLATGGNGSVQRLEDDHGGGMVIKVAKEAQYEAELEQEAAIFQRLAEVGLADSPHLVRCLGMQEVDGRRGLVLEELTGGTLYAAFELLGNLNPSRADRRDAPGRGPALDHAEYWGMVQSMLRGTMEGLATLEQAGFQHLDAKGANVMLDDTGRPVLVDLASVTEIGAAYRMEQTTVMTPELKGSEEGVAHGSTDSFAMGKALYQLVEGTWDLEQLTSGGAMTEGDGVAPGTYAPGMGGSAYVDFVQRLLHPDPEQRMTASEALEHPFLADPLLDEEEARERFVALRERQAATGAAGRTFGTEEGRHLLEAQVAGSKELRARCKRLLKDADKLDALAQEILGKLARKGGEVPAKVVDRVRTLLAECEDLAQLLAEPDEHILNLHTRMSRWQGGDDEGARARGLAAIWADHEQIEQARARLEAARKTADLVLSRARTGAERPTVALDGARVAPPPPPGTGAPGDETDRLEIRDRVIDLIEELRPLLAEVEGRSKALEKEAQKLDKASARVLEAHLAGKRVDAKAWAGGGLARTAIEAQLPPCQADLSRVATVLAQVESMPGWMDDEGATLLGAAMGGDDAGLDLRIRSQLARIRRLRERQEAAVAQARAASQTWAEALALRQG